MGKDKRIILVKSKNGYPNNWTVLLLANNNDNKLYLGGSVQSTKALVINYKDIHKWRVKIRKELKRFNLKTRTIKLNLDEEEDK